MIENRLYLLMRKGEKQCGPGVQQSKEYQISLRLTKTPNLINLEPQKSYLEMSLPVKEGDIKTKLFLMVVVVKPLKYRIRFPTIKRRWVKTLSLSFWGRNGGTRVCRWNRG